MQSRTHRSLASPVTIGLLLILCGTSLAVAQPSEQGIGAELTKTPGSPVDRRVPIAEQPPLMIELKAWSEYIFSADIDSDASSSGGDQPSFSVARLGGQAGLSGRFGSSEEAMRWRWTTEVSAEASWYNFDNATTFVPGAPMNDLIDDALIINITPGILYQHTDDVAFYGGALVQFAGESGADVADSATFGGFFGSRWQLTDTFALKLGAAVKTRLEDNVGFLPAIGFDWRITDNVRLATEGAGLKLSADIHRDWTVFLQGSYNVREYRLEEDEGSSLDEGIFRDRSVAIGVGVDWRPIPNASITLGGGVIAWGEVRFDDRNGIELAEEETDPTGYIGVTGRIRF